MEMSHCQYLPDVNERLRRREERLRLMRSILKEEEEYEKDLASLETASQSHRPTVETDNTQHQRQRQRRQDVSCSGRVQLAIELTPLESSQRQST